jgi:hypothetical protein
METILEPYLEDIQAICEKYQVHQLYVFGSIVTNAFDPATSDIDFLVEFQSGLSPLQMGENLLEMQFELEALLNKKVDLVRIRPFANKYFAASVENTKQLLYAA